MAETKKHIEVDELPRCTFCNEVAWGKTDNGVNLCGIPGNHPEYDNEILTPYFPKPEVVITTQ